MAGASGRHAIWEASRPDGGANRMLMMGREEKFEKSEKFGGREVVK